MTSYISIQNLDNIFKITVYEVYNKWMKIKSKAQRTSRVYSINKSIYCIILYAGLFMSQWGKKNCTLFICSITCPLIYRKRVVYIRIGPRHNAPCAAISMSSGTAIPWVDKIRYLGVFIARSHVFRCDLDHAKKSFYRAANAIFGKVGHAASEEVVIQLLVSKCWLNWH